MTTKIVHILMMLLCFSASYGQHWQAEKDTMRILFLGNSYTHTNNLPGIIAHVIEANGDKHVISKMFARDGQSLEDHWGDREVHKSIETGNWEYVILQERSGTVLSRRKEFQECVRMFAGLIRKAKAQPILYLTPTSIDRLELQDKINRETWRVARMVRVQVAPAGVAFKQAYENRPALEIYDRDRIHPSPVGSYLIACVFYSSILRRPAVWRPRIAGYFGLGREDDEYLRDLAAQTR